VKKVQLNTIINLATLGINLVRISYRLIPG
jgi:hypothetical protein